MANISEILTNLTNKINEIDKNVGDVSTLNTTEKIIVPAINELDKRTKFGVVTFDYQNENALQCTSDWQPKKDTNYLLVCLLYIDDEIEPYYLNGIQSLYNENIETTTQYYNYSTTLPFATNGGWSFAVLTTNDSAGVTSYISKMTSTFEGYSKKINTLDIKPQADIPWKEKDKMTIFYIELTTS